VGSTTDNSRRAPPTMRPSFRSTPTIGDQISLTHKTFGREATYSFLTMGGARIRDLVPDQRCAVTQHPPILFSPVIYTHDLSLNSAFPRPVTRAPLRGCVKQTRERKGRFAPTASWQSRYQGLQSVWSQSTIQYPWTCGEPQTNAHRYGRLTVTPLISTGMFMHASIALQPSGMFRSIPQYSRFPYARQSQAGQTTSQNAPCGTRSSLAFFHISRSRPITSLSCFVLSLSTAREEFSLEACRVADSMSINGASMSEWQIISTIWTNIITRQTICPGLISGSSAQSLGERMVENARILRRHFKE